MRCTFSTIIAAIHFGNKSSTCSQPLPALLAQHQVQSLGFSAFQHNPNFCPILESTMNVKYNQRAETVSYLAALFTLLIAFLNSSAVAAFEPLQEKPPVG